MISVLIRHESSYAEFRMTKKTRKLIWVLQFSSNCAINGMFTRLKNDDSRITIDSCYDIIVLVYS